MSIALVVKGANFATNKIKSVTFGDTVPCTALALSDNTHSFTAIGATKTLTATPTPSNTTDTLSWASSDENVATVADGVVTCVGVGSATITATCGTQTATCSITSTVTVDANTALAFVNAYILSSTNIAQSKDYVGVYSKSGGRIYAEETGDGHKAFCTTNDLFTGMYPILIPKGTKKIVFTYPTKFNRFIYTLTVSDESHTYNTSPTSCKATYTSNTINNVAGGYTIDMTQHAEDYDSFVFSLESVSYSGESVTGDVTVVFSGEPVS